AELRCDVSFSKGPQLAQFPGDAKVALHHDKGITFTGTLRQGWPLPADFKHAAETTAPPPAAAAAVAAMVAAAPAAGPRAFEPPLMPPHPDVGSGPHGCHTFRSSSRSRH